MAYTVVTLRDDWRPELNEGEVREFVAPSWDSWTAVWAGAELFREGEG